jgi:hypothetical protein
MYRYLTLNAIYGTVSHSWNENIAEVRGQRSEKSTSSTTQFNRLSTGSISQE